MLVHGKLGCKSLNRFRVELPQEQREVGTVISYERCGGPKRKAYQHIRKGLRAYLGANVRKKFLSD